jgi:hypothetical protein
LRASDFLPIPQETEISTSFKYFWEENLPGAIGHCYGPWNGHKRGIVIWNSETYGKVIKVASKIQAHDHSVTSPSRPNNTNLVIWNTDGSFSKSPSLNSPPCLHVPKLDSLISTCCDKTFRVFCPRHSKDTPFVLAFSNLMG